MLFQEPVIRLYAAYITLFDLVVTKGVTAESCAMLSHQHPILSTGTQSHYLAISLLLQLMSVVTNTSVQR